ncbi:Zinc finger protein 778-like [Homarus americanus]|uniref:Zinc finger protein 778-like n=1 Tax=Homarus americanus TaxID=6706 RepID=A0A8J5JRA3_HOMAM|nr:Zinc finger protein 778-like [Homarus americanus]
MVTNKYMRTLALVKQDSMGENVDNVLEEDSLNLEASTLAKDDKDFKVYMGSGGGGRARRGRRGRGRGRPPSVKLEVKQEEPVEVITGLAASDTVETLKHQVHEHCMQGLLSSSDSNDGLGGRLDESLEDDGGTDMLMVEEEILEDSSVVDAVEDVMEISGLTLPTLNSHELGVEHDSQDLNPDHHLLEDGIEKYKCRFCSLKLSVFADMQTHMRESHPERLYECEVCQERLTTKAELVCHLEHHIATGEKQFACTMCPRRYALPRQLKEHFRHHMNKTFACSQCPKRFRSEAALQEHFNVHTGNRPYGCGQCCKKFTSKHILKTHMKTHGVHNVEAFMKVNPPTVVAADTLGEGAPSPTGTIRTMKLDDEQSLDPSLDGPVQLVRGGVRDGETVEVVSRPVHIIEADDLPRYIIHTTGGGERNEEGVGHFFASLQGQVVEVRAEDIERYTDLATDQITQVAQVAAQVVTGQPANNSIQQVAVSSDLRPFNIQLEPGTREITLQTQTTNAREVSASVGVATATAITTRDVTLPTVSQVQGNAGTTVLVGGRQMQYESGGLGQGTLRKVLTDRDELRTISVHNMATASDSRSVRQWQQQSINTSTNNFIGD